MSTRTSISHRAGTKAARAHLFVRERREQSAQVVIPEMVKKFDLTQSTARNWFQSFKARPMDLTPKKAARA